MPFISTEIAVLLELTLLFKKNQYGQYLLRLARRGVKSWKINVTANNRCIIVEPAVLEDHLGTLES